MYQIAIKRNDHYTVFNNHIIYCEKGTALTVLRHISDNTIMGEGEYVMLEYGPFKVYRLEGDKLVNITTKKEKV